MPENTNQRVIELLSWHGQSGGGVHIPFQQTSNPLGAVIETPLVDRLRMLANEIAASDSSRPRWIFLVGGPGNGKSETVQDFLTHLDSALGLNGALCALLTAKFTQPGLLQRRIKVTPGELGNEAPRFASKLGELTVIQDATATDTAMGDAAGELANEITDLITTPCSPMPVFVACANRGLLSRAMNAAYEYYGPNNETTVLLAHVIQASSLGGETLAGRKPCWPLQHDERFACWPLDVDSLLVSSNGPSPLDEIVSRAVAQGEWETSGRCQDCTSREICPFRSNAESLRAAEPRANLLSLLRRGELARGQRWSFRDAFSLVAELIVGQWDDFPGAPHPCEWVHQQAAAATAATPGTSALLNLTLHLYHHALFSRGLLANIAAAAQDRVKPSPANQPITTAIFDIIAASDQASSTKPIREILTKDYARLDPAIVTHANPSHALRLIEEAFCQSVEQGAIACQPHAFPQVELSLLQQFDRAEHEWDLLGRDTIAAVTAVCVLRKIAGMIAKRSCGVRLGYHALQDLLQEYESCLRDPALLGAVRTSLQPLLGQQGFAFNLVEILGQPTAEAQSLVSIHGIPPGILVQPAPTATATTPGHDVPCIEISDLGYRIPLTFNFYMALRLRSAGCAGSSLPASVRAALDRVRHRYAGDQCRDENLFVQGRTTIQLPGDKVIGIVSNGSEPSLVAN